MGFWRALKHLAEALTQVSGRLVIYSPHTQEQARDAGLFGKNIECRGFVPSERLIGSLREGADVLFIPMSFDPEDRANMEVSFPSKLTDSSIPGIPLLIYGPRYCSAVKWARDNPGTAEVVDEPGAEALARALRRLCQPSHRCRLGTAALMEGNKYFSYAVARRTFFGALTGA